jgi:hypothetical protein
MGPIPHPGRDPGSRLHEKCLAAFRTIGEGSKSARSRPERRHRAGPRQQSKHVRSLHPEQTATTVLVDVRRVESRRSSVGPPGRAAPTIATVGIQDADRLEGGWVNSRQTSAWPTPGTSITTGPARYGHEIGACAGSAGPPSRTRDQ